MKTILLHLVRRKRKRPVTTMLRYLQLAKAALLPLVLATALHTLLAVPWCPVFFGTWAGLVLMDHIYAR